MSTRPCPSPFTNPFFSAHAERRQHTIVGHDGAERTYTFPTFFTQTAATLIVTTASTRAVEPLVRPHGLFPVHVARGRCLFVVSLYRYGHISDGMVGYNEAAIGVPVARSRAATAEALLRTFGTSFGLYVLDLPVDSEENCHRGVTIWGLPKTMKRFQYDDEAGLRSVSVWDGESLCMRVRYARGGKRRVVSETNRVYSVREGTLLGYDVAIDGACWQYAGVSKLAAATQFEWGSDGIYGSLGALSIEDRPLLVREFDNMNSALYLPRDDSK